MALAILVSGCAGPAVTGHRMAKYRPSTEGLDGLPQTVEASNSGDESGDGDNAGETATNGAVSRENDDTVRKLGRGDRIVIYLRGIPQQEEIKDIIDGFGEVNLPYIGELSLSGKTTSEAERLIETRYVDGGIYRQINVIVVAEDEMYFVQGQVAKQGKFPLSGPVTLLQAIREAGGYSPVANRKKIKVIRGSQVLFYNGKEIADGKEPDPPIRSDDIIEVLQKVI